MKFKPIVELAKSQREIRDTSTKKEFGLKAIVDFREGFEKTIKWCKANKRLILKITYPMKICVNQVVKNG
jgi:hypothetical protein